MKLNDLFEIKKEIKNRNPVAQELRANPQFKAKTEIDKKKEVKKGYQKHKGKVEEASGYQGQAEPTYHVFKNADIKKIVDTIKAKNLKAYPEKTADGVKVHTFDLDRSAVAKELDINETLAESDDTTYVKMVIQKYPQEWKKFLDTGDLTDAPNIYEKLFVYFHFDTGEMPYGTAKARDGDPYVWIADKLADLGLAESTNETMDTEYNEVKAILDKHGITSSEDIYIGSEAYEELFDYYMNSGEMPYGVMKARTGMPDEWIVNRVDDLGLVEQVDHKTIDQFHKKLDKLVHKTFGHSSDEKKENIEVSEADLNAWYAEQYAKELAEKEGKTWDKMSYGDKEDYRKIANKKYGVVKSENTDVPTQKGRDAKHDVLTPRSKNKVLQQIKHDANKQRRADSKKAVADVEIENESIKKTEYDNMLNVANRNRDTDLARIQKLAGIVPMQMQEDYAKMTHELISKLIKDGKSDQEIQARTGETSKRIEIIRSNIEKETSEATQDLARSLNPFKSAVDTNMSPQLTAKGLDAITKGARPTPNEIKAVEPYVSKLAKAISNPTTAAQVRNVFKKVQ